MYLKVLINAVTAQTHPRSNVLLPLVQRLELVATFLRRHPSRREETAQKHCERGIHTASVVAHNLAELVRGAFVSTKTPITQGAFTQSLRDAFNYHGIPLASLHLRDIVTVNKKLLDQRSGFFVPRDVFNRKFWEKEHFGIVEISLGVPGVRLKGRFLESVCPHLKEGKQHPLVDDAKTRCPCMYPVEGRPAVIPEFFKYAQQRARACLCQNS